MKQFKSYVASIFFLEPRMFFFLKLSSNAICKIER
jgi:hypothetical protein